MANGLCRKCGDRLTSENARRSRGRWVGACRACETEESQARNGRRDDFTTVRLPVDLHRRLRAAAEERELAVSRLLVAAVENFLRDLIPVDDLRLTVGSRSHLPKATQSPRPGAPC
jgi:hypothetical protein